MRYFIKRWVDSNGRSLRARGAFREGCEHLLPEPRDKRGVWSAPKPFDIGQAPQEIRSALERDGFFLQTLPDFLPEERSHDEASPSKARRH
jgi:hypothetical protein